MKARVKGLHSPDVPDLTRHVPAVRDDFAFLLQILAGPAEADGEESFDVFVCTPTWLRNNHQPTDIVMGRHKLIVFEYDYGRLWTFITSVIESCEGATWQELAERIGRLGKWEFEDYQAAPHS
jgi:Immunity protein 8